MRVYLDLVILLNFAVNYGLLRASARLTGASPGLWRLGLGAGVGAVYAGLCVLPGLTFLSGNLWKVVFLGLMVMTAFGVGWQQMRQGVVVLCLSLAMGGALLCLGLGGLWNILLAVLVIGLLAVFFCSGAMTHAGQLVPVTISLGGKQVALTALRDSGNTLKDPFSGRSVLVAQADAASRLLPVEAGALSDPAGAMERLLALGHRCRLIPYRVLGGEGMLLAVQCDRVTVNGKGAAPMVAFAPGQLSPQNTYQALTGGGQYE